MMPGACSTGFFKSAKRKGDGIVSQVPLSLAQGPKKKDGKRQDSCFAYSFVARRRYASYDYLRPKRCGRHRRESRKSGE